MLSDPLTAASLRLEPAAASLASAIERGLGLHHSLTGVCAVRFTDAPAADFSVRLHPGRCAFEYGCAADASTSIALSLASARVLHERKGVFDYRDPALAERITFTGDGELFTSVFHSLQRPPPGVAAVLRRAEAMARASEAVAQLTCLEHVADLQPAALLARIARGLPFVITDALAAWPLVDASSEALVAAFGQVRLKAALADTDEAFGDFVARALSRQGSALYTLGSLLPEAMQPSFPVPILDPLLLTPQQLWMGAGRDLTRPVTPLHRDLRCGLLGQVHGRKRLTLFPPHHAEYLYPKASYLSYQTCWVDPSKPDLERYPLFKEARAIEAVLSPGELLVQPAGWFHCVYSLSELTMSVSSFLRG